MSRVIFDEENKEWTSCDGPSIYNPNISLGHILLRSMETFGPKIAQISDDTGDQLTFDEIRIKTIRAAQNLSKLNIKAKQVIGIISRNVANLAPIVFALLCLGCPISTMPTTWKRYIITMLETTKPELIFCEMSVYDLVVKCLKEVGNKAKVYTLNGQQGDSESVEILFKETGIEDDFIPTEVDGMNDTAFISSTSATTGSMKGVCLSPAQLILSCHHTNIRMHANGIVFNSSTLNWVSGVITLLYGTVGGALRVITTEASTPEGHKRLVKLYKLTLIEIESPYLFEYLKNGLISKTDFTSIKHSIIGGCKVASSVREEFKSYLPNGHIHDVYGFTETGDISIDYPNSGKSDSAGRLVGGVIVKIIDEHGKRCGVNVYGKICVKTAFKFIGYVGDVKFSKDALDDEGFFATGDIGRIDVDGILYIGDRKKDIIFGPYYWIFPTNIEEVIIKSAEIENVCVVGVPFELDYGSVYEVPVALVVRANGSSITKDEICKLIEDNLTEQYHLRGVFFIPSIPLTITGKPLRGEIKIMAEELYKKHMEDLQ